MKFKCGLTVVGTIFNLHAFAQNYFPPDSTKPPVIYSYVDEMPVPGYNYNQFLADHLHYPRRASKHNIQGRVIIKFIVDEEGNVDSCHVIKGIGSGCDEEALRVVKSFPKWKPGRMKGKPIKVYFTLPIVFTLTDPVPPRLINN